jgi:hypothetical protein
VTNTEYLTAFGWLIVAFVLVVIVAVLVSEYLEHRRDQIEQAMERHPSCRRNEEEER